MVSKVSTWPTITWVLKVWLPPPWKYWLTRFFSRLALPT